MDGDAEPVFDPWYDYLAPLEFVVFAAVLVAAVATFWSGVTDPGTDLGVSVGIAVLFGGFVAFVARWSVSEARTATLPAFDSD